MMHQRHRTSARLFMSLLSFSWLLLLRSSNTCVQAYQICAADKGGGICPDNDTCCPTSKPGVSSCISSKEDEPAVCCTDGDDTIVGVTGCPNGYECLVKTNNTHTKTDKGNIGLDLFADSSVEEMIHDGVDNNSLYCHRIDPDYDGEKPKPLVLPRYKLTGLPHKVFTQVYGLPLHERPASDDGGLDEKSSNPKNNNNNNNNNNNSEKRKRDEKNCAYFSSMGSLESSHKADLQRHQRVTTVLIVVHGSGRTAEDYLYGAVSSLPKEQQDLHNSTMMVISPWFLDPADDNANEYNGKTKNVVDRLDGDADESFLRADRRRLGGTYRRRHSHDYPDGKNGIPIPLPPNTLRWYEVDPQLFHTWRFGANAIDSTISSFDVMDHLVERLVDDPVRFPSLTRILVTGHSAGGQFVQRWALLSNSPVWKEPSSLSSSLSVSLSSPSHEKYASAGGDKDANNDRDNRMTSELKQAAKRKLATQRNVQMRVIPANPRCFAMLTDQRYVYDAATNSTVFRRPDAAAINECPDFNKWIWGLEAGGTVMAPYKDRAIAAAGGPRALAHRYVAQRNVFYLAGGTDLQVFDDDCGSVIQGETRRERSKKFMASLHELYPQEMKAQLHKRFVATGVPHDHTLMFQSPAGQKALFGNDP